MMKKITLKGIRDSFSSKFALSPSRSTGNLDNVVSTVIADDEDDDIGIITMTVGTTSPVNQTNLNGRGPCQPPLIFHCPPIKSATLSIPKVKSS